MRGKSKFIAMGAVLWAQMNPGKRGLIVCGTEESAKEHRRALAEHNGGARPFNVKVSTVGKSDGLSADSLRSSCARFVGRTGRGALHV